ncbi:hypothetical protein [Polymorphospora sp. NPDC050346]|uniref:hypothetical protein n=1 Tax=Polymorphospora sp. NPDC050346 TaxID=3155780 RepID=UPI003400DE5C
MAPDADATDDSYPYLRAYGRLAGWPPDHITALVRLARTQDAPTDAVFYQRGDDRWVTTSEMWETGLRRVLGLEPLPPIAPDVDLLTEEVARVLWRSSWLTDRNGLRDVARLDSGLLRLTFATGATGDVHLRLAPPQS